MIFICSFAVWNFFIFSRKPLWCISISLSPPPPPKKNKQTKKTKQNKKNPKQKNNFPLPPQKRERKWFCYLSESSILQLVGCLFVCLFFVFYSSMVQFLISNLLIRRHSILHRILYLTLSDTKYTEKKYTLQNIAITKHCLITIGHTITWVTCHSGIPDHNK